MFIQRLALVAVCIAPLAFSQPPAESHSASRGDTSFAKEAAEGGIAEVKLGELAQMKAVNPKVKMFAQRMITDHTNANNSLKMLAAQKNINLPGDMNSKQKSTYKTLSEKSGDAFDKAYITAMIKDHEEDIAEFQKEADSGTDADIKAFAAKTLPTLKEHLQLAKEAAQALGIAS